MNQPQLPKPEKALALAEALDSWAQNEEMVDQFFTVHGRDCCAAAEALRAVAAFLQGR